jgi:hypothetical protein
VLHHVAFEVAPSDVELATEFWRLLGFEPVEPPGALAASATWLEREGTQVHLLHSESPAVRRHGHTAVLVEDFEASVGGLRDAGFEVTPKRELWGSPRALAIAPGGHQVELFATPPPPRRNR